MHALFSLFGVIIEEGFDLTASSKACPSRPRFGVLDATDTTAGATNRLVRGAEPLCKPHLSRAATLVLCVAERTAALTCRTASG